MAVNALRVIPEGAELLQPGLYVHRYERTILGNVYLVGGLYASEGYCYYDLEQAENYDEEGNLLPPEQRVYSQYTMIPTGIASMSNEELNARFISVPVQDGYEIVSVGTQTETVTE